MKKLQIKEVRTLNKGRVELFFKGDNGKRVAPITTKDRGYKKGDFIDSKTLLPL